MSINNVPRPATAYQLQQKIYHQHNTQTSTNIPAATEDKPSALQPSQQQHTSCNRGYTISTAHRRVPAYQLQQKIYHQHNTQTSTNIPAATEDKPSALQPSQQQHTSCNRGYTTSTAHRRVPAYQLQQNIYNQHRQKNSMIGIGASLTPDFRDTEESNNNSLMASHSPVLGTGGQWS